jgi:PfaB family protein
MAREPIAIIGLGCLFPDAANPATFWQNLVAGIDSTSPVTTAELGVDPAVFYDPQRQLRDGFGYGRGGYVRDAQLDLADLALPDAQLRGLDPLYAWALHVARQALADSGYLGRTERLERCGAVFGNLSFPTRSSQRLLAPLYAGVVAEALGDLLDGAQVTLDHLPPLDRSPQPSALSPQNGAISGRPAALIAQALELGGPYFALDAACASSLYALGLACEYLATGQADLMLAGAVSCADPLFVLTGFSIFQAYPPAGAASRPLDRQSRGLTAGEGAGAFALKRYADAVRDGDRIYGLVRGIGLSNDGAGKHLLVPNPKGQQLAFERAYADAGVAPQSVDYVECHATGTPVGDIIELNSMERFFGAYGHAPRIGSVKSNFGHLLTVAGMAGMLKVLLSMAHNQIPLTINVHDPLVSQGGSIGGAGIVREQTAWPAQAAPRRAGVSAFGFGGTNAHVVLEEYTTQPLTPPLARHPSPARGRGVGGEGDSALAIIGMDGCFGPYADLAALDRGLYAGERVLAPLPPERWYGLEQHAPLRQALGLAGDAMPEGAYLSAFDVDFLRAKIPPNPGDQPLPQQLLLIQVADRALRDAGVQPGANIAVLVAMETEPAMHQLRGRQDLGWQLPQLLQRLGIELSAAEQDALEQRLKDALHPQAQVNQYVSFIGNIMACRVAALWDFSGPAFTISADEGGAFRALEVAQLLLARGESEAVVVAAVDLAGSVERAWLQHLAGNSPTPVGEGAGAVVLRSAERARTAQARIYATIDGLALRRHADPATAVALAAQQVLHTAGVPATEIGYLELSADPASMPDAAEQHGLRTLYAPAAEPFCAIGSVTAHIGQCGAAAGMAALLRTALALAGRYLPTTLEARHPSPQTPLPERERGFGQHQNADYAAAPPSPLEGEGSWGDEGQSPFYRPIAAQPWLARRGERRRAAISGRASDGSAAHLLLSAEPDPPAAALPAAFAQRSQVHLLPLAATGRADLLAHLDALEAQVQAGAALAELTQTALRSYQQQAALPYALALVARTNAELLREIAFARSGVAAAFDHGRTWETPQGSCFSARPLGPQAGVAFVYPGAFSAYVGLGRELLHLFPALHSRLAALLADAPATLGERRLYPRYRTTPTQAERDQAKAALRNNPLGMIQTSLGFTLLFTSVLREQFGLQPTAAFGYSMGEASMLWSLGAWQADDAALQHLRASPLFTRRLTGRREAARAYFGLDDTAPDDVWAIYIAQANPDAVHERLRDEQHAFLTHINTPHEVVISGAPAAVRRVIADLGCEAFRAPFSTVMHCAAMHSEYADLVALNRLPTAPAPGITFYGAADYAPLPADGEQIAHALARATCHMVDFPRLIERVYADGARIFIEPGPANACTRWVSATLAERPHVALAFNRQGSDDAATILGVIAQLMTQRVPLDLTPLLAATPPAPPTRTLIKPIRLGGSALRPALLDVRNREILAGRAIVQSPPPPLPEQAQGFAQDQHKELFVIDEPPALAEIPTSIAAYRALLERRHATLRAHAARLHAPHVNGTNGVHVPETFPSPTSVHGRTENVYANLAFPHEDGTSTHRSPPSPAQGEGLGVRAKHVGMPAGEGVREDAGKIAPVRDPNLIWDTDELLEFAEGRIAPVFGPEYAVIDNYSRRVRLPLPPYLLVSRVTRLQAERGNFQPSTITTEYDIPHDAWYLVDGQAPTAVAVESGQCDLLLISYLGIDFECRGERVYRLLDCTLTFLDELPKAGDTLRYDISINSFARSGDTLLFFFSYECFVGERMVLKMDGGCAGFFSDAELADGRGVVDSREDIEQRRIAVRQYFPPPLQTPKRSLSASDLDLLIAGDLAACFGPTYDQRGRNPSLRLPTRQLLMIDRVASIDPQGGDWGLGLIIGEQDLTPESWFFPCHFLDDQVMAGSLMAEGCSQLLQIYMLALGLQTHTFDARFQPIPGVSQVVRCRGQVQPTTGVMTYRLEVTELGCEPRPYAKGNIDVILNGRAVVRFRDLALQLVEKNPRLAPPATLERPAADHPPVYDEAAIQQFTTGSIAACFGPAYAIYDQRRAPRNPNGDLQLISRVLTLDGQRGDLRPGSNLVAEYDVPANPWFCRQNSYPTTPYSVLMEIALQPCGFLTSALGTTLSEPEQDFYFRNLDGSGHLLHPVDLRGRRITARATLTASNAIAGIIIQKFDFALALDGRDFYVGDAAFGYFSAPVLANQTGLDSGRLTPPWHVAHGISGGSTLDLRGDAHPLFIAHPARPHARLAGGQLGLLDHALIVPQGGLHNAGYVYAEKQVDPTSWFFPCHFYSDPVMPGSLGVEAIIEAIQAYALHCGLTAGFHSPHFTQAVNQRTVWKYRGQIIPSTGTMSLAAHITRIEQRGDQRIISADASLWRDGLRIYEVRDLAVAVAEAG